MESADVNWTWLRYWHSSIEGCTSLSFKILEIRQKKGRQFLEAIWSIVFVKMWKIWEHTSISSSEIKSRKNNAWPRFMHPVHSPFNQQWSVYKVFLIGMKCSIRSEFINVINSCWKSSPLWFWWRVININHMLFSFAIASFHSWGLEWRHLHTKTKNKEEKQVHKYKTEHKTWLDSR